VTYKQTALHKRQETIDCNITKNTIFRPGGPLASHVQLSLWAFLKTPHKVSMHTSFYQITS